MNVRVLVLGAGKIGSTTGAMLASSGDYRVTLADLEDTGGHDGIPGLDTTTLDATDSGRVQDWLRHNGAHAVVSCLPWFANPPVAVAARAAGTHYFDLTEDLASLRAVREVSAGAGTAFVPMCGLAPGFVSIAAAGLIKGFDAVESVHLRVGALPAHPDNALNYALTWSTDGLINEYGNPCPAIVDWEAVELRPLDDLDSLEIEGVRYEAFNTSGGLGTLQETMLGRVRDLDYKTLRYPGHCALMRFLMQDLRLNQDRDTLKRILERALPTTDDDLVLLDISVRGVQDGASRDARLTRRIQPRQVAGRHATAIQVTTAAGACAVLDHVLAAPDDYRGFVRQEDFDLGAILGNRFGKHFSGS